MTPPLPNSKKMADCKSMRCLQFMLALQIETMKAARVVADEAWRTFCKSGCKTPLYETYLAEIGRYDDARSWYYAICHEFERRYEKRRSPRKPKSRSQ